MAPNHPDVSLNLIRYRSRELLYLYQRYNEVLGDDKLFDAATDILFLQTDVSRAKAIFELVEQKRQSSIEEAEALLKSLVECARHAYSSVYHTTSSVIRFEETGLFERVDTFLREGLRIDPIPSPDDEVQNTEEQARRLCTERDSFERGTKHTAPLCCFTDLPLAQMVHIIPTNTAGALPSRIWFWLWLAIILPPERYEEVWSACGGKRNNALSNVIMMCQPMHNLFDNMAVSLRPIVDNPKKISYQLELKTMGEDKFKFEGLRHADGEPFDQNRMLTWRPAPRLVPEVYHNDAPSPLLFAIHGYFASMSTVLREFLHEAPPAPPVPVGNDDLLKRWMEIEGTPRKSGSSRHGTRSGQGPVQSVESWSDADTESEGEFNERERWRLDPDVPFDEACDGYKGCFPLILGVG
jgi:hypothetical protein